MPKTLPPPQQLTDTSLPDRSTRPAPPSQPAPAGRGYGVGFWSIAEVAAKTALLIFGGVLLAGVAASVGFLVRRPE
jgi:hypothetical protein